MPTPKYGVYEKVSEGLFRISTSKSFDNAVKRLVERVKQNVLECPETYLDKWKLVQNIPEQFVSWKRGDQWMYVMKENTTLTKAVIKKCGGVK